MDFTSHAASLGATAESVANPTELGEAFKRAKTSEKTYVICMKVDALDGWTEEGHAWWEVGTPEVSESESVLQAHKDWEATRSKQRTGV